MTSLVKLHRAAFAALLLPCLASSNDAVLGVGAGGIVLGKSDAIAMKKEVLDISRSMISVDYEFVNESAHDVTETIVFPLPAYPAMTDGGPTYYGQPAGFTVKVDGKAVAYSTRVQAIYLDRDITASLKQLGLSDAQIAFNRDFAPETTVPPLSARQRQELTSMKLLEKGPDGLIGPLWNVQVNYLWKQAFPAGKVVRVHHAYRPFVWSGPGVSRMDAGMAKTYCADKNFLKAWNNLAAQTKAGWVESEQVSYILKSANTWKRGIDDFTLNVHKRHTAEIVSLCFPGTFKKINGSTYQVRLSNFRPAEDLKIYFGNVDYASGLDHKGVMPAVAK